MSMKEFFLAAGACLFCLMLVNACAEVDDKAPGKVTDLCCFSKADALIWDGKVSHGSTAGPVNTRILAWTSPGDDGHEGRASLYDMRYFTRADLDQLGADSASSAMSEFWDSARQLGGEPWPAEAGTLEQWFLPRIAPGETIWLAIKSRDEVGNESGLSNIAGPLRMQRISIPLRPVEGDTARGFGGVLAAADDVNGDGSPDMVAASPGQGGVSVVLGAGSDSLLESRVNASGIHVLTALPEMVPAMTISGDTGDSFGASAAGLFKVNADGFADVAAGAPGFDSGLATDAGAVFIKFGSGSLPRTLSASSVDVILTGESGGDSFGASLSPAFDIDGDGGQEFMAGAPGAFSTGAVYFFRGQGLLSGSASRALLVIKGEEPGDGFGRVVSTIGDVNGDGVRDVAVAAPFHDAGAGAVYVFYGGDAGVAGFGSLGTGGAVLDLSRTKADVTIRGSAAGRSFGKAVTAGGDLAGDGDVAFDLAVSGGDTVYVFFGGLTGAISFPLNGASIESSDLDYSARLSTGEAGFGVAIAGAGDLDKDGVSDIVAGSPSAGNCYVFKGPVTDMTAYSELIPAPFRGGGFGSAVAGVGDLNLDGFPDILIGAPGHGQAYLVF